MNQFDKSKLSVEKTKKGFLIEITILIVGFGMWVLAGLWHNFVLPLIDPQVEAHHDGLMIMLISYFILSMLMMALYIQRDRGLSNHILDGLQFGVIIGILWVFPHGLAIAGAHDTSILYEINNACWHMVEQGIGGIMIAVLVNRFDLKLFVKSERLLFTKI